MRRVSLLLLLCLAAVLALQAATFTVNAGEGAWENSGVDLFARGDDDDDDDDDDFQTADPPCFDYENRFVDCDNGTVADTVTGLIWLKNANCVGRMDWVEASEWAATLQHGQCGLTDRSSRGDWRLPTIEEWNVIKDRADANGCLDYHVPDTQGRGCWSEGDPFVGIQRRLYWSSTSRESSPRQARFFKAAVIGGTVQKFSKNEEINVWPVRSGQ
jgi:hypothetical protein